MKTLRRDLFDNPGTVSQTAVHALTSSPLMQLPMSTHESLPTEVPMALPHLKNNSGQGTCRRFDLSME
jgi:hypothetical protein